MPKDQSNIVYVIAGATASGKTAAAIDLAGRLGTAIVSADSRQCYKEMTIGTAKPNEAELAAVKHYFIDEFAVTAALTAADYEKRALGYLETIFATNNTAVVCGGTGLYIQALCEGLDDMPDADKAINREVEDSYKEHGLEWLQQCIAAEDPQFYAAGEIQNPARLIRALAFVRTAGQSILQYRTRTLKERPFKVVKLGLELPRSVLYERINTRVDLMMQAGLEAEVAGLLRYRHLKNLQTVGYAELFDYMDGKCSRDEAVDKIKQHTRNYAKRQMTWFRKDKDIQWFDPTDPDLTDKMLQVQ